MDKDMENKISASIWRDITSKPITVVCPSGAVVKMIKLPFSTLIKKDLIPSALVSTAIGIMEGRSYIEKGREAYLKNIEVIGRYVKECVVEPMITLHEDKASEDVMFIDDIPDADKLYITNVAMHFINPTISKRAKTDVEITQPTEQPEEATAVAAEEVSADYKKFRE